MSARDTGGAAFPEAIAVGPAGDVYPGYSGMTLRDWFAGQALAGLLAARSIRTCDPQEAIDERERKSKACYALADAMLAERDRAP